jgi:hypothetical protein
VKRKKGKGVRPGNGAQKEVAKHNEAFDAKEFL